MVAPPHITRQEKIVLTAAAFRGDAGEVLRQASAVLGRPVTLWEVTGAHEAVARATSEADPQAGAPVPTLDLGATLRRWNVPIPIGSRWVGSPGDTPDSWVVAPVRARAPAPPPGGRERRSRDRLALELVGLALGAIGAAVQEAAGISSGILAHQASNPLTAARAGLQLSMESIGRWVDLAADRRLSLLDDLGQVLDDIDRTTELLRAVRERGTTRGAAPAGRPERFDAVRVIRSCLTLERRLLRDRGIELEFTTSLEASYLRGDPNALFDVLVNLVRSAAESSGEAPSPVTVRLELKGRELELMVRGRGGAANLAKARSVTEETFGGKLAVASSLATGTTFTLALPLPPQREADRKT
jgi:signal transduction histidine kinase